MVGADTVRDFRRENTEFRSNPSAYREMLRLYNEQVRVHNEEERTPRVRAAGGGSRRAKWSKAKVKSHVTHIDNSMSAIRAALTARKGENILLEYIWKGKTKRSVPLSIPAEHFSAWWKDNVPIDIYPQFQEDSANMIWDKGVPLSAAGQGEQAGGSYPDGDLYIWKANPNISSAKVRQAFREGVTNCLLTPIHKWATEHKNDAKSKTTMNRYKKICRDINTFEMTYREGVPENDISMICDKLQIDMDITTPFADTAMIEGRSVKKALAKFKYINSRIDHIDLNNVVSTTTVTEVTRDELHAMKRRLDVDKVYAPYRKDMKGVVEINTLNGTFKTNSDYLDCVSDFEKHHGLRECKIDDIHDKDISRFVRDGVHYNATVDFDKKRINQGVTDEKHIDMRKAYASFTTCKYYNGFLGKITDLRKTDKIVGVGMYLITNLVFTQNAFQRYNSKMRMYENDNIYTDAECRMLNDHGVTFTIVAGCWGVKEIHFNFDAINSDSKSMLTSRDEEGVPYYSKWTGACNSWRLKKSFWIKGSDEYAKLIQSHCPKGVVRSYENGEIQIEFDKPYSKHLSHITAFITAYMRINVIEQILSMDMDTIVRVCCDGIYYTGPDVELKNVFETKMDKMTFVNGASDSYCSGLFDRLEKQNTDRLYQEMVANTYHLPVTGGERVHNAVELHLGEGGSGKTHHNLSDRGLVRTLFIPPSWKLSRSKTLEMGCKGSVWARAICDDPERINIIKASANVIVWDEVSMMSVEQQKQILKTYPDIKHIFCGDLGFQLPCISGTQLSASAFSNVVTHSTNYRRRCDILKEIVVNLREMIDSGDNKEVINRWVLDKFRSMGRVISYTELLEAYTPNDMILTGTTALVKYISDAFSGKCSVEKYYVKSNNRLHSNGDIIIGDKPDKTDCEIRHAFTVHSLQGETAHHKLYIDSSRMFDVRMFYTAISRAKEISQIYVVEPNDEMRSIIKSQLLSPKELTLDNV